jgi:methylenetetrahydrofolate reductase (NADPH)
MSLRQRLDAGRFVVTAEVAPPVTTDPAVLLERALPLRGLASAVNVTDGAGARAHLSSIVAAHILNSNGIEPIVQMTCRDRNRLALQSDLLGALALGLTNYLMLSGDDPSAGDQPEAKAVFDYNSSALLQVAQRMRAEHRLPTGTEISGPVDMLLGAADAPVDPPKDWNPKSLFAKADAGVSFIQTQFCMDLGVVRRYAARLADLGLAERLRILIGVCPIPSARSARWMREKLFGTIIADEIVERLERAADPRAEGRRICVDMLHELAQIPGIAGAHVMSPANPAAVPEVIEAAGMAAGR